MAIGIGEVRSGMRVRSSDGVELGAVREVWWGVDPEGEEACDERRCSRLEVHPTARGGLLGRLLGRSAGSVLYVPCNAASGVEGQIVALSVDAGAAGMWTERPGWLSGGVPRSGGRPDVGPGSRSDPGMGGSNSADSDRGGGLGNNIGGGWGGT